MPTALVTAAKKSATDPNPYLAGKLTPSANSVPIYLAAKRSAIPAEIHIFAKDGHGFGMAKSGAATDTWTERFRDWMAGMGLLTL